MYWITESLVFASFRYMYRNLGAIDTTHNRQYEQQMAIDNCLDGKLNLITSNVFIFQLRNQRLSMMYILQTKFYWSKFPTMGKQAIGLIHARSSLIHRTDKPIRGITFDMRMYVCMNMIMHISHPLQYYEIKMGEISQERSVKP